MLFMAVLTPWVVGKNIAILTQYPGKPVSHVMVILFVFSQVRRIHSVAPHDFNTVFIESGIHKALGPLNSYGSQIYSRGVLQGVVFYCYSAAWPEFGVRHFVRKTEHNMVDSFQ